MKGLPLFEQNLEWCLWLNLLCL